jgi:NTP pyrophosphatase (non-canonical NTP hydrolase)
MTRNEEIMTILQEECAEVIQAVSKVRRFGLSDNVGELKKELCDLICMIELMREFNVIPMSYEEQLDNIFQKREKLKKFSRIFEESKELRYEDMNQHQKNSVDWFGSPNGA